MTGKADGTEIYAATRTHGGNVVTGVALVTDVPPTFEEEVRYAMAPLKNKRPQMTVERVRMLNKYIMRVTLDGYCIILSSTDKPKSDNATIHMQRKRWGFGRLAAKLGCCGSNVYLGEDLIRRECIQRKVAEVLGISL